MIVTHNSAEVLGSCLDALSWVAPKTETLLIDNASVDGTLEQAEGRARRFPMARIIANDSNRGFAGAVNQGFRDSAAECVLLLNPDVEIQDGLEPLEEDCGRYGLSAGMLTDSEGRPQSGFSLRRLPTPAALSLELLGLNRLFPSNSVNRRYRCFDLDLSSPQFAEQPAGAFLMIRRDVWSKLGGFDEQFYPVWFEDVDFCRRALEQGFTIRYNPAVRALHRGGHSVNRLDGGSRVRFWYVSLLKYAAKHFTTIGYRSVCLAAGLSTLPRMVAGMIRQRSFAPVTLYLEILQLAGKRLLSAPRPMENLG